MKNLRRSLRVLGALSLTGTLLLGGWSAQAAAQPETPSPALAAEEEDWQNTTVIARDQLSGGFSGILCPGAPGAGDRFLSHVGRCAGGAARL